MLNATQTQTSVPGALPIPREVRCLLLDDSNFDRARIRRLSKKTNFCIQLDEVDSIAQLDAAVACENYDLVLIDYCLPVGDGMVALEHVLRSTQNRSAGKIMITGDDTRQTVLRAMRAGCHAFLTKEEISVEALQNAMLNALSAARQRRHSLQESAHPQEMIRKGLISAIQDSEVQSNVVSFLQDRMSDPRPNAQDKGLDSAELEALLAWLNDRDDHILH